MGILRADRITGLGGANAITGSCFFDVKNYLFIDHDISLDGDFTIEWWTHRAGGVTNSDWFTIGDAKESNGLEVYIGSSGSALNVYSNNGSILQAASGTTNLQQEKWHHMACVRSSNTIKIYVNGTVDSTTVSNSSTFTGFIRLGAEFYNGSATIRSKMHMSNFRIVKGTALYTSNFTPPNTRLENVTGTEVLCCQSSGNILQEATGKTIVAERANNALTSSNVKASRFTPNSPVGFSTTTDVGSQYGSVFDGFGNFATSTYMVPPAGNTRERNRGRAVMPVGARSPYSSILGLDISSEGIAQDFGELNTAASLPGSVSSSTRMLVTGMGTPSNTNIIEFITIANIASSEDFGDMTVARRRTQSLSNSTRGVHVAGSGTSPLPYHNTIDYNAIATAGNSIDFGDTSASTVTHGGSVASSTRGIYDAAYVNPAYVNSIEYITIASTGNGQDFGDLSQAKGYRVRGSICDTTRGLFAGGYNPVQDTIEFVTMATLGNSTDFGNLTVARRGGGGTSNSIKSVFMGGYLPGTSNVIDAVVIQTTGNAKDFGDLLIRTHDSSASSDSHGGLS